MRTFCVVLMALVAACSSAAQTDVADVPTTIDEVASDDPIATSTSTEPEAVDPCAVIDDVFKVLSDATGVLADMSGDPTAEEANTEYRLALAEMRAVELPSELERGMARVFTAMEDEDDFFRSRAVLELDGLQTEFGCD